MITNMTYRKETWLVMLVSFLFIFLNTILISKEFYYFNIIPWLLLLVLLAFYSIDRILLLVVFFTPLSVELSYFIQGLDFDLHLPTEPLMLGTTVLVILKYFKGEGFDRRILYHPVSIAIYFNLLWILITSITSSMFLVSFKFLFARIWFLVTFYFLAAEFFKDYKNIRKYIWVYVIPMIIIVFYVWVRLSSYGFFNQRAAHMVVKPFFIDHTSYGAILAFLIPVITGFLFGDPKMKGLRRLLVFFILILFVFGIILSYSRAAWISLIGAVFIFILIRLKIRFSFLVILGVILGLFIYSYRTEIVIQLEQNRQASSKDLAEHVKSISNVATDASNMERLNRWSCAWRMFKEKPVFGWGPGTYQFQYGPFQVSREKTIISTNFGDVGNAHSEYIGPLAESGFFGTLTFLWIVIAAITTGLRTYRRSTSGYVRILTLSVLLGLTTYLIHGMLNNFLDTDKASALFWGFIAILVTVDLYHQKKEFADDKGKEEKTV
jgi:putative inorganic carbon (HCO3(-)) transporter